MVNPITVNNFAALFNYTPAGRASGLIMIPTKSFQISWLGLDALSLIGHTGVQLFDFFAPAAGLAVEYLSCFISVMNLDLHVHCFDSLMSRSPSRGPNNLYVYINHSRTQGEVERS